MICVAPPSDQRELGGGLQNHPTPSSKTRLAVPPFVRCISVNTYEDFKDLPTDTIREKIRINLGIWLAGAAVVLALIVLAVEYGFARRVWGPGNLHFLEITACLLYWAGKLYSWIVPRRREFHWSGILPDIGFLLILLLGLWLGPVLGESKFSSGTIRMTIFHIYLFTIASLHVGRFVVAAAAVGQTPTRVLLISFLMIIFTGAALLMLPAAHRGEGLHFTDAVFTATSATCVTGLVVQDTGGDFTRLGQSIILVLMQIGGLGIMIFGSLFALLLGSQLTLKETVAMRDIMQEQSPGRVGRIVVFICIFAFVLEAIGAIGLYGMWQTDSQRGGQLFKSMFHAVSAFCNAGFALQADNLESYRACARVYLILAPLILLGGLGFPVLENLWNLLLNSRRKRKARSSGDSKTIRLSLHSKIVLSTSLGLLLLGGVMLLGLELFRPDGKSEGLTGFACLDAMFNSITARTAGFDTVCTKNLSAASKLVLIFLMSVGGSPSSTAGGIKTVTLAVMILAIIATIKRRRDVQIFRRTIPVMIIRRASTLMLLYGLLLWLLTLMLTITEHSLGVDMLDLLFEVASALGTVGLSTGVTEHLTLAGKWVIIIAMFVGRLGPLSLLAALTFNARPVHYEYPAEPLVVG
jgi:trk/ktr system potassium uptake protein